MRIINRIVKCLGLFKYIYFVNFDLRHFKCDWRNHLKELTERFRISTKELIKLGQVLHGWKFNKLRSDWIVFLARDQIKVFFLLQKSDLRAPQAPAMNSPSPPPVSHFCQLEPFCCISYQLISEINILLFNSLQEKLQFQWLHLRQGVWERVPPSEVVARLVDLAPQVTSNQTTLIILLV